MKLNIGDYVRYIIPRANGRKKRYQYSRKCYRIVAVNGNMYTISARGGTVKNLPRFKVKKVNNIDNIEWSKTIPSQWNGDVKELLDYDNRWRRLRGLCTSIILKW